jgi:hypothetical protein
MLGWIQAFVLTILDESIRLTKLLATVCEIFWMIVTAWRSKLVQHVLYEWNMQTGLIMQLSAIWTSHKMDTRESKTCWRLVVHDISTEASMNLEARWKTQRCSSSAQ